MSYCFEKRRSRAFDELRSLALKFFSATPEESWGPGHYGDVAGLVDVSYSLGSGNTPQTWCAGYNGGDGDDLGVIMASTTSAVDSLSISLTALGGNSFYNYAAAIGRQVSYLDTLASFEIYADGYLIFDFTDNAIDGQLIGVSGGLSNATTLQFVIYGDWNVGFQSIKYNFDDGATVPLPASALLLFGGVAGLAGLRRRRRSA